MVVNGKVQESIDKSNRYMSELGCMYHKDGKKGPTLLVYQRKNENLSPEEREAIKNLNIDG